MSTEFTPITTSMLREYLQAGEILEYHQLAGRAMTLLAEVLSGEYDLQALHREILEETQP